MVVGCGGGRGEKKRKGRGRRGAAGAPWRFPSWSGIPLTTAVPMPLAMGGGPVPGARGPPCAPCTAHC